MNCSNCQAQNRPEARFCDQCGSPLEISCPNCGNLARPGAKFCDNCGQRLVGRREAEPSGESVPPPAPQSASSLHAHIPQALHTKLESARREGAMVGERRIVTMLFCDVKGSTAAASRFDPEEWAEIINGAFEYMIRPVFKYEGTVARLMGDGILAFFGAPLAHEDDPQRAVLSGLEIAAGFEPYRQSVERRWDVSIDVRVGINTGLVMVGQVGSDLQMEYTALGDAINLAARMEQTAEPGTVQIAADTYKLVAPLFEFEDLGEIEVKGISAPVRTYRPLRLVRRAGRLRGRDGGGAPLVGRDRELARLQAALGDLRQGRGAIIALFGEAGLGKSRLIQETRSRLDGEGNEAGSVAWYETAALSYETNQPYALFQRLLRRLWEIGPNEPADRLRARFAEAIPGDGPGTSQVIETMFGLQSGDAAGALRGEAFRQQLFEAIHHLWAARAAEQPLVLVFDDLHWADPASVALLQHLFRLTDTAPVVLLCASRPDRQAPGWEIKVHAEGRYPHRYTELDLAPLDAAETDALVQGLLSLADLPTSLRRRILEKTEGNPFFVEEVVRSLIDQGLLVRENGAQGKGWRVEGAVEEIDIPDNLHALLIARIDRLEGEVRKTLQLAAVIGRSFYYRVLETIHQAISAAGAGLEDQLLSLQRAELIREAARLPELEFVFRHSLTQESAYKTILHKQRRAYHLQVGEAIEELYPDRLEEFSPVLARHFTEAKDPRALHYERRAGDAAFRLYAIPEAIEHYSHALTLAGEFNVGSEDLSHLYRRLGRALELQNENSAALKTYLEMEQLAQERGDQLMEMQALVARATVHAIPGPEQDPEQGKALAERALALARQLGDARTEARIQWVFMLIENYAGRMGSGIPYGERAVALARENDLRDLLAHSLQDLALAYMAVGALGKMRPALEEAEPIWRQLGDLPMLAENYANSVLERVLTGELSEAISMHEKSLAISQKIDNQWGQVNSRVFVGLAFAALGEIDRAVENYETLIPAAEEVGHPAKILSRGHMAWTYLVLGAYQQALEISQQGVDAAVDYFLIFRPYPQSLKARALLAADRIGEAVQALSAEEALGPREVLLLIDIILDLAVVELALDAGEAQEAFREAGALLERLRATGADFFLPEVLRLKSAAHAAIGEPEEAFVLMKQAAEASERLGMRTLQWTILAELAQMTDERGETAEAEALRSQARRLVEYLAARTSPQPLRSALNVRAAELGL